VMGMYLVKASSLFIMFSCFYSASVSMYPLNNAGRMD
jgi:hypothetical protein